MGSSGWLRKLPHWQVQLTQIKLQIEGWKTISLIYLKSLSSWWLNHKS